MTSQGAAAGVRPAVAGRGAWAPPDTRRWLQLGLAAIWVLDGVLQYQSVMFSRAFGQQLAAGAAGNPAFLADSVRWAAGIIEHSPAATNSAFATIQLALGLGIAWRPATRLVLAASVAWAAAVWWFGEALGGLLNGTATPLNGAPGAVILYALLAVLVWPAPARLAEPGSRRRPARLADAGFAAAGPAGPAAARVVWAVLWGSLAVLSLTAAARAAQGLHDMVAGMAAGEPSWLAGTDRAAAALLAHRGLPVSVTLAIVLAAIAAGVFLPARGVRITVAAAIGLSALIWVIGQDLGGILAGGATDVNSGPLLALTALAYWPASRRAAVPREANPSEAIPRDAIPDTAIPAAAAPETAAAAPAAGDVAAPGRAGSTPGTAS